MSLASGHNFQVLEGEELEIKLKKFPSFRKYGLIRLSPGGWLFPEMFKEFGARLYSLEVKPSDVYVMTFPKVGTTWTQEIIWTMKHNPNLDHPESGDAVLERSPYIDLDIFTAKDVSPEESEAKEPVMKSFSKYCPDADLSEGENWQIANHLPEPRLLKTHLPLSLMPPTLLDKAKVVYVARNPRDVVCSYYHSCGLFSDMKFMGSLDEFCQDFINDDLIYSPYWLHVKEAWEKRHHPNMHLVLYEDLKNDIMKELRKINDFLGTKLTEEQLENVRKHTSFIEMQKRDNLLNSDIQDSGFIDKEFKEKHGGFFRKGKTGEGKKNISAEMLAKMDDWSEERFNFGLNYE